MTSHCSTFILKVSISNKTNNMNKTFLYLLPILIITSCAQGRFNRLIRKHPELIETQMVTRTDTITVNVDRVETDTVVRISELHDTVVVTEDRLRVQMHTVHDSLYITAACDSIIYTEYVTRDVAVVEYKERKSTPYKWWLILILTTGALIYILKNRK